MTMTVGVEPWERFPLPPDQRMAIQRYIDARVTQAAAGKADLLDLVRDFVDPDPCSFDHHGYCQAHGWLDTEPRCPHARAKEMLDL